MLRCVPLTTLVIRYDIMAGLTEGGQVVEFLLSKTVIGTDGEPVMPRGCCRDGDESHLAQGIDHGWHANRDYGNGNHPVASNVPNRAKLSIANPISAERNKMYPQLNRAELSKAKHNAA